MGTGRPIVGRASRKLLAAAVAAVAVMGPAAVAGAQPGSAGGEGSVEQAVALVQPATVRLQMDWNAYVDTTAADFGRVGPFQFSTACTGFVVDPNGYIVTAGHCLDASLEGIGGDLLKQILAEVVEAGYLTPEEAASDEVREYVIGNWQVEGAAANSPADLAVTVAQGIALSGEKDVKGNRARVIEVNPPSKGDVALIKTEARDLPILPLADDKDLDVGTNVLSVGYPGTSDQATDASMTATFKDGKISSKKTREGGLLPVYEVSAAMSQGMSGGPTVTTAGEVVGLNSFYPAGENQQFNFLSPVSLIKETLTRNGVHNQPAPIDERYRQGVTAYYAGDFRGAVAKFDEVLQRQPSHQQAQALRTKAVDKAESQPAPVAAAPVASTSGSGGAGILLALAGVTLLVLGGITGLVILLVRSGGRRPAVPAHLSAPAGPGGPGHGGPTLGGTPLAPAGPMAAVPDTAPAPPFVPAPTAVPTTTPERLVPVPAATATGSYCGQCGHHAEQGNRFCPACGHDLGVSTASAVI